MPETTTANTRERLLQAAATLMWERSFQSTGVDELCTRAEARKGSFYHYFPSKTDLAIAAIESSWARVRDEIFEPVFHNDFGGLEQIRKLVDTVHELQVRVAAGKGALLGCPFGNLGQEMALQDERIRVALQKIFDAHCAYLERALVRAEQAGDIPRSDNRRRACNIFALLEGAMLLAKVSNDAERLRSVAPAVMAVAAAGT